MCEFVAFLFLCVFLKFEFLFFKFWSLGPTKTSPIDQRKNWQVCKKKRFRPSPHYLFSNKVKQSSEFNVDEGFIAASIHNKTELTSGEQLSLSYHPLSVSFQQVHAVLESPCFIHTYFTLHRHIDQLLITLCHYSWLWLKGFKKYSRHR